MPQTIEYITTMNYTDNQLKQALAKMQPDCIYENGDLYIYDTEFGAGGHRLVSDTELLHLCWLVEKVLIENDKQAYNLFENRLFELCNPYTTLSATWQQRVAALAKVKGIEI